ncbi:MAG: glycosyltransferase [Candidatus Cloacimonetes bacterium HGW-Cloacimonetes-1]|jgi:rhamnosyltransferase|nr:MAG: glycosyltransferase [Candidatus Cloacimonetes bacterium HGW-Cloacimonetes-1]
MISIIIRSKNEMPWLKYTLLMLSKQSKQNFEVIAVDSGSTDGSWEFLQEYNPAVLYQIAPEDYIPGKVLNEAIRHAKGNIIVFNNADCIPQSRDWLKHLVRPLLADNTAATFCRQIPRLNAHPLVQKDYERAFGDGSIHKTWRHFFSLASSAVKRDLIVQHPFNEDIRYSEDIEWSWRMKQQGLQIKYVPEAIVEHSHNYNVSGLAKRFSGEGKAEAVIYHDLYQDDSAAKSKDFSFLHSVLLPAGMESVRDILYLIRKGQVQWIPVAPCYRGMQKFFSYKGRKIGTPEEK